MGDDARRPGEGYPEDMLKEKYLDYCSARVAEVLLSLSPDEMYVLAESAAGGPIESGSLSYDQMVRLATARISESASLPRFAEWSEDYRSDPAPFDALIIGLWESDKQDMGSA